MSKLVMFSMKGCAQCVQAAGLLDQIQVTYEVVKVDEDAEAFDVMQELGLRALPQFFYKEDSSYIHAFDYNKLRTFTNAQFETLK